MPDKKQWKNCNRFSEKLGQKILQQGLNGQKLARKSEVSDSEISRIMNGKSLPGLENAWALARALDVSLDYLADDSVDEDPARPQATTTDMEGTVLKIIREMGATQAFILLENARHMSFDLAMTRLLGTKPTVEAPRGVAAHPGPGSRLGTA